MNIDKEVEEFLQGERRIFKERKEETPCQEESRNPSERGKFKSMKIEGKSLKEKWKEGKKELKLACHNINGLKTKGWKLENLLSWAEEEEIAIMGITETNLTEREKKFLTYAAGKRYVGFWTNAAEDKKKGSGIGIVIDEQ